MAMVVWEVALADHSIESAVEHFETPIDTDMFAVSVEAGTDDTNMDEPVANAEAQHGSQFFHGAEGGVSSTGTVMELSFS